MRQVDEIPPCWRHLQPRDFFLFINYLICPTLESRILRIHLGEELRMIYLGVRGAMEYVRDMPCSVLVTSETRIRGIRKWGAGMR